MQKILQVVLKITFILVEEKIKGVMVKRHIIDAENFRHILTVFGDKLNEVFHLSNNEDYVINILSL